jgi:hypothetical protein
MTNDPTARGADPTSRNAATAGQTTGAPTEAAAPPPSGATTQASGPAARQYVPRQQRSYEDTGAYEEPSGAAMGFTIVAAVLLMVSGTWNILEGIAAIVRGSFFVTLPRYTFDLSVAGWGWFHLILGIVVLAAGIGLLTDQVWARAIGVAVAAISAIVNFLFIPYQPVWSVALIVIDLAIVWALLTPRRAWS